MSRSEVTCEIKQYIHERNLQDPTNALIIRHDAKLHKLLRVQQSDELTWCNIQNYMSPHFLKFKDIQNDTQNIRLTIKEVDLSK